MTLDEKDMVEIKSSELIVIEEEQKTSKGLVLKELLGHLRYAFLGEENIKPMIMSARLNEEMEQKFLEILNLNMEVFA